MNKTQQRQIALQAARGILRRNHVLAETCTADDALNVLDDLLRLDSARTASIWYANATENQLKLFSREWRQWCAERSETVSPLYSVPVALRIGRDVRETYSWARYTGWRAGILQPIQDIDGFFEFCRDAPGGKERTLSEWGELLDQFIAQQDAAHNAVDQSERSDGLEDTADAALGRHFEPVAR